MRHLTIKSLLITLVLLLSFTCISCDLSDITNLFKKDEPTEEVKYVTVVVQNGNGSGKYKYGTVVSATNTSEYFDHWEVNGVTVSSEHTYQFVAKEKITVVGVLNDSPSTDPLTETYKMFFKNEVLQSTSYKVYVPHNTEQIEKSSEIPTDISQKLTFNAASNERESAQLMLYSLKDVTDSISQVIFTDFYKNDNTVIRKTNMSSYIELYTNVDTNWNQLQYMGGTKYPNGVDQTPLGVYPDALMPVDAGIKCGYNSFTLSKNQNQGLYFTLSVPKNTEAGTYHGQVEIYTLKGDMLVIPVEINVFDFELDDENHNKSLIQIAVSEMQALYQGANNESLFYTELFDFLKERGISGGAVSGSAWGSNTIDKYIANLKKVAVDPKVSVYNLSMAYDSGITINYSYKATNKYGFSYTKTDTLTDMLILKGESGKYGNITTYGYKDIFRILVENSTNEVDLLKKAIIYFPQADEPSSERGYIQNILCQNVINIARDYCLENCDFTGKEEVKKSLENITYLVTCEPNEELYKGYKDFKITSYSGSELCYLNNLKYKTVDGYIPLFHNFIETSKTYNNIQEILNNDDDTMWWYGCIMPVSPYATFCLNAEMVMYRANKWQEFYLGVEGYLFYMCNRTQDYADGSSTPKTEAQLLAGGALYEDCYDDGLLVYPVYNLLNSYNSTSSNPIYYLSSLRLENVSESIDDYNYLYYAQSLINKLSGTNKTTYQEMFDSILHSVFGDVATNTKDSDLFYESRLNLAHLIENILKIM